MLSQSRLKCFLSQDRNAFSVKTEMLSQSGVKSFPIMSRVLYGEGMHMLDLDFILFMDSSGESCQIWSQRVHPIIILLSKIMPYIVMKNGTQTSSQSWKTGSESGQAGS